MANYHGYHVFGDFIWDVSAEKVDDTLLANNIFEIMEKSVRQTSMTIVHKKLVILGQTPESPPGFTSIILIDESHVSAHCYADRGLLALDVFTCGKTDPKPIMNNIEKEIKLLYPTFRCIYNKEHERFHFL